MSSGMGLATEVRMGNLKSRASRFNHVAAWAVWSLFYGGYSYFVAVRVPFHWPDFFGFLLIHIASFYFSVRWAFPFANPQWNRFNGRTVVRLALVVLLQVIVIPLVVSALSIALNALRIGFDTSAETVVNVVNFLDVVVFLYSGLIFALFYLKFTKVEQERDDLQEEVDRLKIQLSDAENANLEQSLIPHLYGNLLGTVNDVVKKHPTESSYYVNMFNQIVRFYARLSPGELVSMADEVAISKLFLELMDAMHDNKALVKLEVEDAALALMVIPMQAMLVMENLGKYADWGDPNHEVQLYIGYHVEHLILIATNKIKVLNSVPPLSTKKGLKSIKERLNARQLNHTLHAGAKNGKFRFCLIIDFD